MSTTIDQKVVEMRFDNSHFEKNVSNTMSTLDKLKQRLNLSGASKGLENVNKAAKNVDMSGLGRGIESVQAKFSAMDVVGVTALANITNSAINAGKRIVSALTIDPVKTGLSEYETKMNAIQVIQANTRGKNTMDDITAALEDLNTYADKTIYNFAQMTSNIGKFTAQGFDVQKATNAVKGLANLAAASGASAEDMARATYQMSQAMGSSIKLMDWNSLRNANMATQDLKDTLIALAKTHGIAIDDMIEKEGTFEYTLQNGWLTGEMFTEAMNIYSGVYSDAELKAKGFTDSQIENFKDLAATAESAATEVKTFTQLWDVLKETAQSGWTQTWELLVGDFATAKKDLTALQVYFSDIINGWSDARNTLLGGVFDPKGTWDKIMGKLDGAGLGKIKEVAKAVTDVTDKLEYFQKVVNDVWRGDYKNSDTGRFEMLEKAGYDHRVVQDLVNKGYNYKLTVEDIEASHKKFGLTMEKTTEETKDAADAFNSLSDEQLKNAGLTEAEIKLYRDLEAEANRTGKTIEEIVDEMSKNDGRTMLIDSLKNAWSGILGIFTAIKNAWVEIFPPPTVIQVYNVIKAINTFSEKLRLTDKDTGELTDTAKKLQRVFKGVFAVVDILATILGGAFRIAFKVVSALLEFFGLSLLDVAAIAGDALVKFRDWMDSMLDFGKVFEFIGPYIVKAGKAIGNFFGKIKDSGVLQKVGSALVKIGTAIKDFFVAISKTEEFQKFISSFKDAGSAISNWFSGIKDAESIPKYLIQGFLNGLKEGISLVVNGIWNIGKSILAAFREVLGIHSPSTETKEDGKNFILGFVEGIVEFAKFAWELIKTFGLKCLEILRELDFGKVFAVAVTVGIALTVKKIADAISALASPLEGLGDFLDNVGKGVKKALGGLGNYLNSKAVLNLAIGIGILAASVLVLSWIDPAKMWGAIGAIAALAAVIVVLAVVASKMSKVKKLADAGKTATISASLLAIAGSLLIVAIVAKMMAGMTTEGLIKAGIAITAMVGVIAAIMLIGKIPAKNIDQIGGMLLKISGAFLILTLVAKSIAKMSWGDMGKAAVGILGFVGVVALLMVISMIPGKNIDSIGGVLIKIAGAFLILTIVAKLIAGMSWNDMAKAGVGIAGIIAVIALLMVVSMIPGKNMDTIGKMLLSISGAIAILAIVAKIIAGMSWEAMGKAAVGLVGLVGVVALLVLITRLAGNDAPKIAGTLLALAGAIAILAVVVVVLSLLNIEALAKGIIAVGLLAAMMALMIVATRGASECKGNLIVMAVAIAVMAAAVAALSMIDIVSLAGATAAMTVLMGMFALLIKVSGTAKGSIGTLIVMTIAVGLMGGLLYLLAQLPVEQTIGSAVSLSILMLAMTGVLAALTLIGKAASSALMGVLALTAMAVPLIAFVGVLAVMQYVNDAMNNVIALSILATVLTVLLLPLTLVGALVPAALLGVLALTAMAVPLLAFVGVLALMQNIQDAEANINLLIGLMTTMTAVLVILAIVGPMAMIGVSAMTSLSLLIAAIGVFAVAIGALMEKFPALEAFLDKGIAVLEKLAYGIGSIVGNLIAGFMDGVLSGLPQIGLYLSQFMINATPFIMGAKLVDDKVLAGVGILAASVLALTAVDLIAGVAAFLQGGSSFASLGTELSQFMLNAMPFIMGASLLNEDLMTGVKALAETVLILTAANVIEGLTSWFAGGSSLAEFGGQLAGLGTNLNQFVTNLGEFDETKVQTVTCASNAIKALAQAAETLPNEGGWAGKILGENSIATFGSYLPDLGTNLNAFATNLGTFDDSHLQTITCASNAIKAMAEAADTLPNEGGWAAAILGENSIATFGSYLPDLGTNLAGFASNLGTFTEDQVNTVGCAANAIKVMAEAANQIPNEGGWAAKIFGDNSLATFGSNIEGLGTNLKNFASNLGTFDDSKVTTVKYAVKAINALAGLADTDLKAAKKHLDGFGDNIVNLSKNIKSFVSEMPGNDGVSSAISNLDKILAAIEDIATADASVVKDFTDSLSKIGKDSIKKFVEAFTSSSAKTDVKKAAKDLMSQAVKGIEDKKKDVKTAVEDIVKAAAKKIKDLNSSFYDAGVNVVKGFVNGIKDNKYLATNAGSSLGKAALKAAKEALKEKSPSRAFYEVGDYAGQGFVNALDDYASIAYRSGSEMADSARQGLSRAISKIGNLINSDIDPNPTIRPVLDLSNVRTGIDAIGNMLDMESSVGVMTNVGAINTMMRQNRQNGQNGDVISAIDKLRDSLGKSGNTTYVIDGITYDDGSNVSDAVRTLVRAAKVERRT